MFVPAIKTSLEFTKWLLEQPSMAPLKGRPDALSIAKAIAVLWPQRGPEYQERVDYLLGEFIANFSNYSASHLAEKVRNLLHTDMLHFYFDVDLFEKTFNGKKLIDIVGDSKVSSCATCFFRALDSHVDVSTLKKIWPDEASIPKMALATLNSSLRKNGLDWLKQENLLFKVFDSTLVQSHLILQHFREAYVGCEEALSIAEQLLEEGFNVQATPISWGNALAENMLSPIADSKITRRIFDLLWSKFPTSAPNILTGVVSNQKNVQSLPRFVLEFAESIPKKFRSDIFNDGSKTTLWHLIANHALSANTNILKVLPKLLEIIGKSVHFISFFWKIHLLSVRIALLFVPFRVRYKCC